MGLFGLVSEKKLQAQRQEFKAALLSMQSRQVFNSASFTMPNWDENSSYESYATSDQIYSVINRIAETFAMIPIYVYEVKKDKDIKQLKAAISRQIYNTKAILNIINLQQKALEDLPEDDWYVNLFTEPNPHQNIVEFLTLGAIYYLKDGEAIGWQVKIEAGVNQGKTKEIYWLPPSMVTLSLSRTFPREILGYTFKINGIPVFENEPPENFVHIKKPNPEITMTGDEFRGMSPLEPFGLQRKVMFSLDKRIGAQVENGNLEGIVYDKSIDSTESSQSDLDAKRNAIVKFMRDKSTSGMPYYTSGEMGFLATGLKLVDMDAVNLVKVPFSRLCNVYKISDQLFNNNDRSTFNNLPEFIKQLYTNACLPMAYSFTKSFTKQVLSESTDKKRYIDIDISAITEIQDDMKDLATVFSTLPVLPSANAILALFKFEAVDEEYMNKPIIKQGYALAETLTLEDPAVTDIGG